MIPCPSCGTRNRRGSKYCYRCGQRLDIVFNVSCPACDRLNPGGSAFCAFCGAKLSVSFPPGEPAVAEQPAQMVQEPLESEPKSAEPAATPQRELPPWLYERAAKGPEAVTPSPAVSAAPLAEPAVEVRRSKYLRDIPDALSGTDAWLSSAQKQETSKPAAATGQTPDSKPESRRGCLGLPLLVMLWLIGLLLSTI